jgi:hypothetical protein
MSQLAIVCEGVVMSVPQRFVGDICDAVCCPDESDISERWLRNLGFHRIGTVALDAAIVSLPTPDTVTTTADTQSVAPDATTYPVQRETLIYRHNGTTTVLDR